MLAIPAVPSFLATDGVLISYRGRHQAYQIAVAVYSEETIITAMAVDSSLVALILIVELAASSEYFHIFHILPAVRWSY